MEIRFTQAPADNWTFYLASLRRSPALLLQLLASWLVLPLLAFFVSAMALSRSTSLLIAAGVGAIWGIRILSRARKGILKRASEQLLCGRNTLAEITPAELRFTHESLILQLSWQSIVKIEEVSGLLCFYRAPLLAFLVPCRAFGDSSQKDAFLRAARSYHQSMGPISDADAVQFTPSGADKSVMQMSVAYDRTLDDIAHTTRMMLPAATGVKAGARYLVTAMFLVGGLFWVWLAMSWPHEGSSDWPIWSLAFLYLLWGGLMLWSRSPWRIRLAVNSMVKTTPGIVGHTEASLDARRYTVHSPLVYQSAAWELICNVTEDAGYIYIYETPRNVSAIPRRAFDTPPEAVAFFHAAREYHLQAKSGAMAAAPTEGVWPPAPHVRP